QTSQGCSCLSGPATQGYCPNDVSKCTSKLYTFMAIMIVGNAIGSTSTTGNFLINFRAVDPMDKSFTSGIVSTLVSILCKYIDSHFNNLHFRANFTHFWVEQH